MYIRAALRNRPVTKLLLAALPASSHASQAPPILQPTRKFHALWSPHFVTGITLLSSPATIPSEFLRLRCFGRRRLHIHSKFLIGFCLLLLVLAPGWTALFDQKTRKKLVLGVVLLTLISSVMQVLAK